MMKVTRLAVISLALIGAAANAATFQFTYAADAGLVRGRLDGTLLADGNTIAVTALHDFVTVGGIALPSLPFVTTGSAIYGVPRAPTATLDGSNLDFLGCTVDEYCSDQGIGFDPDTLAFTPVFRIYAAAIGPGLIEEAADAGRWNISAVPEPASWSLLVAGFGLVGVVARRRVARVTA